MADMTEKEWIFERKRFLELYKSFARNPRGVYPCKLIGEIEHQNAMGGYKKHIPMPVLFGDEAKAQLIYEEKGEDFRLPNVELKSLEG